MENGCRPLLFPVRHIINPSRSQLHPDTRPLTLEVKAIAAGAISQIGLLRLSAEFVHILEVFSRIELPEDDLNQLHSFALRHEPTKRRVPRFRLPLSPPYYWPQQIISIESCVITAEAWKS